MEGESAFSFAKKCGITDSLLRSYLAGRSSPGLYKLEAIAKNSNVSLDWLVLGRGPKRPDGGDEGSVWTGQGTVPGYPEITPTMLIEALEAVEEHFEKKGSNLRAGKVRPLVLALCTRAIDQKRAVDKTKQEQADLVDFKNYKDLMDLAS
ncbi:MAG: helix-turn-helix transcriptional regulator [Magnetococcales bacterium]|nr:helix-turn-helix transcriptional regulator [Magnetococcales bacterium]